MRFWDKEYTKIATCKYCKEIIQYNNEDGFWDSEREVGYHFQCADGLGTIHKPDYSFKQYFKQLNK